LYCFFLKKENQSNTKKKRVKKMAYLCPCSSPHHGEAKKSSGSKKDKSEPETCTVHQSPLELSTNKDAQILHAESHLQVSHEDIEYKYDHEKHTWNIRNKIDLSNNQRDYSLIQFHIHQRGEHVIDKQEFPLEIHFVFSSKKSGCTNLTVLGFVTRLTRSGESSTLWKRLLKDKDIQVPDFDTYFSYVGSLTTPPFGINVNWLVVQKPLRITTKDLQKLKHFSKVERPLQKRQGRDIILHSR